MTDAAVLKINTSIASRKSRATKSSRTMRAMAIQWPINRGLFFIHRLWEGGSELDFGVWRACVCRYAWAGRCKFSDLGFVLVPGPAADVVQDVHEVDVRVVGA